MKPQTRLGRILLTGGDRHPVPRDACRTPEDVDATLRLVTPTPEEVTEAVTIKAMLGRRR